VTDVLDLIGEDLQKAAERRARGSHRSARVRDAVGLLRAAPHDGRSRWRWRPLALVLVVCLGGGTAALAAAGAFPTNTNGQTYGSAGHLPPGLITPGEEPDLILATGRPLHWTGYVTGYILRSQLDAVDGADVTNPAQEVAWTEAHTGPNSTAVSIPLYAQDGTTVIGTAAVGGPPATAPTLTRGPTGATSPPIGATTTPSP
jgi:hypothetical protein